VHQCIRGPGPAETGPTLLASLTLLSPSMPLLYAAGSAHRRRYLSADADCGPNAGAYGSPAQSAAQHASPLRHAASLSQIPAQLDGSWGGAARSPRWVIASLSGGRRNGGRAAPHGPKSGRVSPRRRHARRVIFLPKCRPRANLPPFPSLQAPGGLQRSGVRAERSGGRGRTADAHQGANE
jgi:hypothetical protein